MISSYLNEEDNNPILGVSSPLCVVCNDAGGCNIILDWLTQYDGEIIPIMQGPSLNLWKNKFPNIKVATNLEKSVAQSNTILSGTGWASDLEHNARVIAANNNKVSIAVLDHWVNYPERFERRGVSQLPDKIIVTDQHAFELASRIFNSTTIVKTSNLYLKNLVSQIKPCSEEKKLVYLTQPARDSWGKDAPGEFQSLDFFLSNINKLLELEEYSVILRPHPSESIAKYSRYIKTNNFEIDTHSDLSSIISKAKYVFGMDTFAMVVALYSGRKVYSTLPSNAPNMTLPYKEIVEFRKLF